MDIKLDAVWGTPIGAYNPDTANNGGGYWQFEGGAIFSAKNGQFIIVIEVVDTSCGDFGTRIWYDVTVQDVTKALVWHVNMGSMDDASIDSRETIDAVFAAIAKELNILPEDVDNMLCDTDLGASEAAWREYYYGNA